MKKQEYNNILATDAWLVLNKALMKELGNEAAILLAYLVDQYNLYRRMDKLEDGAFFKKQSEIEEGTNINPYKQRKLITNLTEVNVLETFLKKCVQPKLMYKINEDGIEKLLYTLHKKNKALKESSKKEAWIKVKKV